MFWDMPIDKRHLSVAIDLARKATALRPALVKNWEVLGRLLLETDEGADAISVLANAISKHPTVPILHLLQAEAYYQTQQFARSRQILDRMPAISTEDRSTAIYRLELVMKTKAAKDIARVAKETLTLDPTNVSALRALGRASRKMGISEIMLPACQAALEYDPGHVQARYELAVAFAILGHSEQARHLISLDQFITITEVPPPQGYANAEAFKSVLVSEIMRNPTLKPDPFDKATKGGLQTGGLPDVGDHAVSKVLDQIRSAVDAADANLPQGLEHPFVKGRPRRATLRAWAVVYPADGRQEAHIHPAGWMSGIYYVAAPTTLSYHDSHRGCLVLGIPEMNGKSLNLPWGIRHIDPVPGRLVLFPSYIPHATIPTRSSETRICIAFDVIPVRPNSHSGS